MKKKTKLFVFCPLILALVGCGIASNIVISTYNDVLSSALASDDTVDDEQMDAALKNSAKLNETLLEEGSVLLKNNGVLPLTNVSKVNTYGIISAHIYPNGSGSGAISSSSDSVVTLKGALNGLGVEVNETLWKLESDASVSGTTSTVKENGATVVVNELSTSEYTSKVSWSDAKNYSEYAIVTIGRMFSEGSDAQHGQLTLTTNEKTLIKELHNQGFKVITLINSSNVIEAGDIDTYSDAVLFIGGPGQNGMSGVADVLLGKVSPSGRTVDTWMRDSTTSSSYYTAESYSFANGEKRGYTNYNEGIYVGYKWYETAFSEGYFSDYGGTVLYPFGYGLSYGELSEEFVDSPTIEGKNITFKVQAKNANSTESKAVFELYVEKPYTNGGVEVPKVELISFSKSDAIKDGQTYETTLTINTDDLAVYNKDGNNGKGAYELLSGSYNFYLAYQNEGAHTWADADTNHKRTIDLTSYLDRDSDAIKSSNKLDSTHTDTGIAIDDDSAGYKELSRKDHFSNASSTIAKSANEGKTVSLDESSQLYKCLNDSKLYAAIDEVSGIESDINETVGTNNSLTFKDLYTKDSEGNALFETDKETGEKTILKDVDFDDPRWNDLLSKMSVDDLETLVGRGGYGTAKIESIGKELYKDYDGPFGLNNYLKSSIGVQTNCTSFCSEVVVASTWNVDLVEELGEAAGEEANAAGTQLGWYAPGVNIHRTIYGGRNAEYFSEDSFISGKMASFEGKGALSKGLYVVAKHFAFNDIEANRTSGENCFMSEQTAREIYLKPFEMGIKDGNILSLMDSYMWIAGEWNGSCSSLLKGIIRDEWGFDGFITTDNAGGSGGVDKWITPARIVAAGGDLVLNVKAMKVDSSFKNSTDGIKAMKQSSKHILYTVAKANLRRAREATEGFSWILPAHIATNVVFFGGALALGIILTLGLIKKEKPLEEGK